MRLPPKECMSITTKFGDKGETRLYSGETVNKISRRIMAVGDLDELVSIIGVGIAHDCYFLDELTYIQKKLFLVGSEVATTNSDKLITDQMVQDLDIMRKNWEAKITLPKGFILPGHQGLPSAYLDLMRSVCRRCERSIVGAYNEGLVSNKNILVWMNRLSDFFYILARNSEKNYKLVKE